MAWASLINNQWVSRSDLQDAVTTGVFVLNIGQSIPGTDSDKWISRTEAETWVDCTVTSGTSNQWPQKSWIIPNTTTTSTTTTSSTTSTTTTTQSPGLFSITVNNNAPSTSVQVVQIAANLGEVDQMIRSYFVNPGNNQTISTWTSPLIIAKISVACTNTISGYTHFVDVYKNAELLYSGSGGESGTSFAFDLIVPVVMYNGETLVIDYSYEDVI